MQELFPPHSPSIHRRLPEKKNIVPSHADDYITVKLETLASQ